MLTQERLKELLHYDPETGVFTRVKTGKVSGHVDVVGYCTLGIDYKIYKAHRLAWLYVYGVWPSDMVDHINNVKSDNRIINLREANNTQNQHNQTISSTSKTGVKNVHYNKKHKKYVGMFTYNCEKIYCGMFEKIEDANSAVILKRIEYHKEYANHG